MAIRSLTRLDYRADDGWFIDRAESSRMRTFAVWLFSLIRRRDWRWDLFVFASYFLTAKLAQYILFSLHTSPALIWAPTGIALAAVLIKGSRMWLPISIGYAAAILTLPGYLPAIPMIIAIIGFTAQPVVGAWGLRRFRSSGSIYQTGAVIRFVIGAIVIASIGPLVNTLGQVMFQALSMSAWLTFSRAWAGGLLGILVCTPFITSWYSASTRTQSPRERAEAACAFGLLIPSIYLLFWTSLPATFLFLLIFFLCFVLIWIALRLDMRAITTALLLLAAIGISGSIIGHPTATPLNQQLFADELFMILLSPIFLIFFSLMEERRHAEKTLAEKVRELEGLAERLSDEGRAKNEFIAILAHELRNPLAAILSTIELVQLENQTKDASRMLERSERETLAMRRLLDDLLDVARITERKFTIFKETADIGTVIRRSIEATAEIIHARGHTLDVDLPKEPHLVSIDPVRIEQVITNLLANATKYTPPGGTIALRCAIADGTLRLSVRDNGRGIPQGQLQDIFLPFRQLNPDGHKGAGVGIGLFLTRHVVELHGGTISAESAGAGAGSTFRIDLPISPPARDDASPEAAPARSAPITEEPLRVLVVDDNESAAVGLAKLLKYKGHDALPVHSGQQAIETVPAFDPDVTLLDIGLPGMDGYETARRIRAIAKPELILIALTGYGQADDREKARAAGFDFHLTKPVGIAEIEHVIAQIRADRIHN